MVLLLILMIVMTINLMSTVSVYSRGDKTCNDVVVLITDGMSTDWAATLDSMIDLYDEFPETKTIVVAVMDPDMNDMPRPDQVVYT